MNYNISKELFEAVIGNWAEFYIDVVIEDTYLIVGDKESGEDMYDIHIDTFFFKCKEWAYKNGFIIDSCKISKEKGYSTIETDELKNIYVEPDGYISRSSEQQAVFDACQWILDNKTK